MSTRAPAPAPAKGTKRKAPTAASSKKKKAPTAKKSRTAASAPHILPGAAYEVKFRARGPFKCVTVEGKSKTGMHPALDKAIGPGFKWEEGTPTPLPKSDDFIPVDARCKNERRMPYSKAAGHKLDQQIGSVLKLCKRKIHPVPLRVFVDSAFRDHWAKLVFGTGLRGIAATKQMNTIRNCANGLTPEADNIIRYMMSRKLTPIATQFPVAAGRVGTPMDLLVRNQQGQYISCELKAGCQENRTNGKLLPYPFNPPIKDPTTRQMVLPNDKHYYSTHTEHIMQTMMTAVCFHHTYPTQPTAEPLLLRSTAAGLYVYRPPAWAVAGKKALAIKMGMIAPGS